MGLSLLAGSALAQEVSECGWQASAWNLVEPWDANSRSFSNGATRVALLDTAGEPAAGSYYLLILSPPYGALGERQCRVVGYNGIGFADFDFANMTTGYDPSKGLLLAASVQIFNGEGFESGRLRITINQASGLITVALDS